uniref:enhancer of polycomb homolog 1-like isoform X1 n=2 Tax=Myxine glutinosa TaxID=7769 RepID=UPI00358EEDAD
MSKLGLSFRARALDASKPLPLYRGEELPDLPDYVSISRAVPQMPTGMEKEEESEHHLQRAISAQQVYGEKPEHMVIPVPETQSNVPYYDQVYTGDFKRPKSYIRIQPLSLEAELPEYNMDLEDEVFVNKLRKRMEVTDLQFEEMIERLEKGSGQKLVTLLEARLLLSGEEQLIREVFEHWWRKRRRCSSDLLISTLRHDKNNSGSNNPYVAFRRRTEKMQTRKNRKNDEASYEKMLKLRRDLSRAVTILEMVKRREKCKRDLLQFTLDMTNKRHTMGDYDGEAFKEVLANTPAPKSLYPSPLPLFNGCQYRHLDALSGRIDSGKRPRAEGMRPKRKYEKRKHKASLVAGQGVAGGGRVHSFGPGTHGCILRDPNQYDFPSSEDDFFPQASASTSEAEDEAEDGSYTFRRAPGCLYCLPRLCRGHEECGERSESAYRWSVAETNVVPMTADDPCSPGSRFPFQMLSLRTPRRMLGLARRRIGRGGRVLLDRLSTPHDQLLQRLQPEQLSSKHEVPMSPKCSDSSCHKDFNLGTAQPKSKGQLSYLELLAGVRSHRWRHFRPRSPNFQSAQHLSMLTPAEAAGHTTVLGGSTRQHCKSGFTLENYQNHLVQLQKQQEEALQSAVSNQGSIQLSRILDPASVQFAVSAVLGGVETVGERLGKAQQPKDCEASVPVNGALPTHGTYKVAAGSVRSSGAVIELLGHRHPGNTTIPSTTIVQPGQPYTLDSRGKPTHLNGVQGMALSSGSSLTPLLLNTRTLNPHVPPVRTQLTLPSVVGAPPSSVISPAVLPVPSAVVASLAQSGLKLTGAASSLERVAVVPRELAMDSLPSSKPADTDGTPVNRITKKPVAMEVT